MRIPEHSDFWKSPLGKLPTRAGYDHWKNLPPAEREELLECEDGEEGESKRVCVRSERELQDSGYVFVQSFDSEEEFNNWVGKISNGAYDAYFDHCLGFDEAWNRKVWKVYRLPRELKATAEAGEGGE
jgi:hypothetical protein